MATPATRDFTRHIRSSKSGHSDVRQPLIGFLMRCSPPCGAPARPVPPLPRHSRGRGPPMTHAEAKPPLSAGDVSAVTADTQELRLATTMTGGVSLAVWMGGVAREIDLLMQASKTRRQLQRTPG